MIDDRLHYLAPDGSVVKSVPAEILTFQHCQQILGTTHVLILRCGIQRKPKSYQNHSILIMEEGNSTKRINMGQPINEALLKLEITDVVVRGPVIVGPSWCFGHLENMGAA